MKRLCIILYLLLIVPSFCFAQTLTENIPLDSNITAGTLDNGIKYFIRKNKRPEKRAELRLAVNVGSVLEDDDQLGLAHLTEHMAFNGTKNFHKLEIINFLERIGMRFGPDVNAYTSFDETVYMIQIPTDSAEIVNKGFQILSDWAHNLLMEDEEINKERGVVIEEWRLGRGAEMRMLDKQLPIILKDSRYADRLPIGKKEILESFPVERIKQFYNDWYRPDLMSVIAVGDFEPKDIEKLIKDYFAPIPQKKNARERTIFSVPENTEPLFAIASDPEATISRVNVYFKRDKQPTNTVSDYRRTIVERLYHDMLNRRLNELTKQSDPPFLFGFSGSGGFVRTKDSYTLGAAVKDNGIERGLEALLTEAMRVKKHGFTASEFERQKKDALRSMERLYNEREKTESRQFADELVRHFLENEPVPGTTYEYEMYKKFLPEITLDEVNRLASQWMTEKNRVVAVNSPEKQGVTIPTEAQLQKVFDAVEKKEITAYVDKVSDMPLVSSVPSPATIVEETIMTEIGVTEWKLSNGVRVVLKPTDFKNDEVLLSAYSPGGHSLVEDKDIVPATTASSVIQEAGVGNFDNITLQKMLQGKIVNVSPYINELEEGFNANCSPADFETMLQLIYLYATSPRMDSMSFISYQTRMRGMIQNRSARPEAAWEDTFQVTMAQYHQRRRPMSDAILNEMNLNTSYEIFKNRFMDCSDFTFFIVGAFDINAVKPFVVTYLGGLPSRGRKEMWRDVGIFSPKGKVEKTVQKGIEPKSFVRMVFSGPFEWSRENRHDLQSMANVLRIKLREVLREDKGGVYGVGVSALQIHYPREEYRITINFGCDPHRIDELTSATLEQIDSLKNYGTTDDYITKVKETQRRERETNLKENRFWLNTLQFAAVNREDPNTLINKFDELVERVTKERVQQTAQKYLDMSNFVKVVLVPAEK
jgi:zinc protease